MERTQSRGETGASTLPLRKGEDLEGFGRLVGDYLGGRLDPDEFKKCRLQLGIYGIRGLKDKQMVRVKVPAGRLTADQFERLAEVVRDFATGRAHVTTRQDIQMYEVPIERTPELLRRLDEVGLTTREACGNSVRNVTACPFAGVCTDELFDVLPYSLAITRHFLRNPVSQALPRKFKISVSGCRHDCAMAPIHDIGAVAASHGVNGRATHGFTLYAGGGLGPVPRSAQPLEPFTPMHLLLPTSEAIIRVFNQHGERKNRQRARMKFLIERIGFAEFQRLVLAEREALVKELSRFPSLPEPQPLEAVPGPDALPPVGSAALRHWLSTNARAQRQAPPPTSLAGGQAGYWIVTVRLPLGDLNVHQMQELAQIAHWCSRDQLITTQWQDLCLPWVESGHLERLYDQLVEIGLALPDAERLQDITACPGADSCQIGITSSRGLARALTELLEQPAYTADDVNTLRIKISGCPNSCGQHHIADIGLFGAAKSVNGRLVPHYQLLLGGGVADGAAHFGQPIVRLPAKRVLPAIVRLLAHYREQRADHEPFRAFVQRVGPSALQEVLAEFSTVPPGSEDDAATDWGQTAPFSLGGMGQGECAT